MIILPLASQIFRGSELNNQENLFLDTQTNNTILKPCCEDNRTEDTLNYDGDPYWGIGLL